MLSYKTIFFTAFSTKQIVTQTTSLNNITLRQLPFNTKYDIEIRANCEKVNSKSVVSAFNTPNFIKKVPPPKIISSDEQVNNIAQKLSRAVKISHKIKVKSDNLKVSVWDSGTFVDGDMISLYLNEVKVIDACILLRLKREYTIQLTKGNNIITSFAHNVGFYSPNTASIIIDDGFSQQKVELNCTMNESEAIQVIRSKD